MRIKILFLVLVVTSCNCMHNTSKTTPELLNANPKITAFLSENQVAILNNLVSVDLFQINSLLIEGTTDEYAKKSTHIKSLNKKDIDELLMKVLNDSVYDWNNRENLDFDPSKQLVFKDSTEQFMILYSATTQQMGIIDLGGLKILKVNKQLNEYLIKL